MPYEGVTYGFIKVRDFIKYHSTLKKWENEKDYDN